jgi:hypothetical protein
MVPREYALVSNAKQVFFLQHGPTAVQTYGMRKDVFGHFIALRVIQYAARPIAMGMVTILLLVIIQIRKPGYCYMLIRKIEHECSLNLVCGMVWSQILQ